MTTTLSERLRYQWYYQMYPLYRARERFRGWLTEATTIEEMISQGKVIVHESVRNPALKQYMQARELTKREAALWGNFCESFVGDRPDDATDAPLS